MEFLPRMMNRVFESQSGGSGVEVSFWGKHRVEQVTIEAMERPQGAPNGHAGHVALTPSQALPIASYLLEQLQH